MALCRQGDRTKPDHVGKFGLQQVGPLHTNFLHNCNGTDSAHMHRDVSFNDSKSRFRAA